MNQNGMVGLVTMHKSRGEILKLFHYIFLMSKEITEILIPSIPYNQVRSIKKRFLKLEKK